MTVMGYGWVPFDATVLYMGVGCSRTAAQARRIALYIGGVEVAHVTYTPAGQYFAQQHNRNVTGDVPWAVATTNYDAVADLTVTALLQERE